MQDTSTVKRLEPLYTVCNFGIVFFDASGRVVDFNPASVETFGRQLRDVREFSFPDESMCTKGEDERFLPVEYYPPFVALHTRSAVQNFIMGIYNPKLGRRRWYSVDAYPICGSDDAEPALACAIFKDITEQRERERELRQSKLHLALAQQIASIGSAAVDFRTGKWDWSDETFRIYGVDRNGFTPSAEGLSSLVHADDWPALYANVPRARLGLAPKPIMEYRIKRPDGAERILRRIAAPVRDDAGQITGIVATVQDITDLRTAQKETKALQSQLYHAQRLDSLGTLASGIAHDLNNTLVPILALSESILDSLDAHDPNRELMELIKQGGERASELVAQILAFARRQVADYSVIDIKTILQQALRFARAGVPASINIVADLLLCAKVMGDQGQLHQVFMNLFSNAAQAIGDGPGEIHLSMTKTTGSEVGECPSKGYVRITVCDTGCGMSEEVQSRIFEPFFTTKRVGAGSGLGLSVVHGIVASHLGHITVKSSPGQGARFDVFLPLSMEEQGASR